MKATAALLTTFALASLNAPAPAAASDPKGLAGDWVTPNKSIVRIYSCDSGLCAKIAHVDASVGHTVDGQNPDQSQRNRPLCGLVIGQGFQQKDPAHAEGGTLYDPESGRTYSGTLTLANQGTLKLRGFIGISLFGRTEQWTRTDEAPTTCGAARG